jgi:UDP-N-acetylglucosamine 2-epimerase
LFLSILNGADCVIGNSSVAIRECSLLGVPAVNIGGRQKNRERAQNIIDSEFLSENIYQTILQQIEHGRYEPSQLYGDGKSGERVAGLIRELLI